MIKASTILNILNSKGCLKVSFSEDEYFLFKFEYFLKHIRPEWEKWPKFDTLCTYTLNFSRRWNTCDVSKPSLKDLFHSVVVWEQLASLREMKSQAEKIKRTVARTGGVVIKLPINYICYCSP